MDTERDPRVHPKPGDVISRDGIRVEVDDIENDQLYFCRVKEATGDWQLCRFALSKWAEQAANAVVEKKAD